MTDRSRLVLVTLAVLLSALLAHGIVAWQYRGDPFYETYVSDALSYHEWAQRIAVHGLSAEPVFHQSPLFPLGLSWLYGFVSENVQTSAALLLQILLNSIAVALLVPLGRLYFGQRGVGVAAAALALAYGPLVFWGLKLLPVAPALATQALAWVALGLARRNGSPLRAALTGVAFGLATLVRMEMLLLLPVAAAALATESPAVPGRRTHRRRLAAATLIVTCFVVLLPVTWHNVRKGDVVLVASSSGENLFIGNQIAGTGGHTALDPRAADIFSQRTVARLVAERALQRSLRPSEISAYWRGRALDEIAARPGGWALLELRKLGRILHPGEPTDLYAFSLERSHYLSTLYLLPATAWCVLGLGAVGLVIAYRKQRNTAWPLIWAVGLQTALLLVFFVDSRLRLPLLYLLTPFGGLAVVEALRLWRLRARWAAAAIGSFLIVAIAIGNLVGGATAGDAVRLASVLSTNGRTAESLSVLAPYLEGPEAHPVALDQAGWVHHKAGELDAARERYLDSLAQGLRGGRRTQTLTRLGMVYERLGDPLAAARQHDAAVATEHANAGSYFERGMFRLRQGERAAAVRDLQQAQRLDPGWPEPHEALRSLGES